MNDPEPETTRDGFLRQIKDNNITGLLETPLTLIVALDSWKTDKMLHKTICMNYVNIIKSFIHRAEGQGGWSADGRRLRRVSYSDIGFNPSRNCHAAFLRIGSFGDIHACYCHSGT